MESPRPIRRYRFGILYNKAARRKLKKRKALTGRIYEAVDRHSKALAARDSSCPI